MKVATAAAVLALCAATLATPLEVRDSKAKTVTVTSTETDVIKITKTETKTQTEVNTQTIIKKETFTKTGKVDILALVLFYVYLLAFFGTFQKGGFPVKDMA